MLFAVLLHAMAVPLDANIPSIKSSPGTSWFDTQQDVIISGNSYHRYGYLQDAKGARTEGWVTFDVTGWDRFTAAVGLSDKWKDDNGSLTIRIGKIVTVINKKFGDAPAELDLPLKGATTITLRFEPSILLAEACLVKVKKRNPKDGAAMVWVPAGDFLMGSTDADKEAAEHEKPQQQVYLDGYWMYKTEVTVAQYRKFCQATGRRMPDAPGWGWQDTRPIVNVSWDDANAYAQWAGAALPTEAQWEKAARGTDGRIYPWGNDWNGTKCIQSRRSPEPVGYLPAGASPYGCLDMAGNVAEWCADWYADGYYKIAPVRNPTGPVTGNLRVLRGGSWYINGDDNFRCAFRGCNTPTKCCFNLGFRCASSSPGL